MLKKIQSVAVYVFCCLVPVIPANALTLEEGVASYYSDKLQGRKTASGEQYDKNKLTAAHRTLPLGTQIEVTNLKNQNSVVVIVNDRGPYSGKLIDLSYAAAKEIGLVTAGTAPVAISLLEPEKDRNFEKIIPLEYGFGILDIAGSEEEVIEAEEELLTDSEKAVDISEIKVKVEKIFAINSQYKPKKVTLKPKPPKLPKKPVKVSPTKTHTAATSEKIIKTKPIRKLAKSDLKPANKAKKITKPNLKKTKPAK